MPANIIIQENVPLAPFTTLGVGGLARFFVKAETEDDLSEAFGYAVQHSIPMFVLGGGSNIVVSDAGFDGLVVHVVLKGMDFTETGVVTAAAGEDWDDFVGACVDRNLAGVECLSGIPGSIGGTPVQNVGAYGQEVSETIVSVRCFDRETGEFIELSNAACGFEYRKSIFNSTHRDRYIVTSVEYRLEKNGAPKIVYKDLIEYFDGRTPTLRETRDAVISIRRAKSMVIDAADPNSRSVGSFFKNPVIPASIAVDIAVRIGIEKLPQFPVNEVSVKIPAAWLIEQAGFQKGFRLGNAGISDNHSLAIVNRGGAAAAEIIALKELIQERVEEKFGIAIEPEPIFVGF